jgi:hypothetical protein
MDRMQALAEAAALKKSKTQSCAADRDALDKLLGFL